MDQFEAARTGNLEWFKDLAATGLIFDFTATDYRNWSISDYAICGGHLSILKWISFEALVSIEVANAELFIEAEFFSTRLAARYGHHDIVEWLLTSECPEEYQTTAANSALRVAAETGQFRLVKELIENSKYNVDVTHFEHSIFQNAVSRGYSEILQYLVETTEHQFSVNIENAQSFYQAVESGHLEVLQYLMEDFQFDLETLDEPEQVFSWAAETGQLEILRYFINLSEDTLFTSKDAHIHALTKAIYAGQLQIARFLIEDPNIFADVSVLTPAEFAAAYEMQNTELSEYLDNVKLLINSFGLDGFHDYLQTRAGLTAERSLHSSVKRL